MLGYLAFAVLAMRTLSAMSDGPRLGALWGLPLYWLLLSVAAWRAVIHLAYKPHEWEKTPHRLRKRPRVSENASTVSGLAPDSLT